MIDEFDKAEKYYLKAISLDPDWINPYYSLGQLYRYRGEWDKARETLAKGLEIAPMDQEMIDVLGWTNLLSGDLEKAAHYWSMYSELEKQFTDKTQYIPFRHRLGYVKYLQGDTAMATKLIKEQLKLDLERHADLRGYGAWTEGGFYYDLAASKSFLGSGDEALLWLDSAYQMGFINLWYLDRDPMLANIRNTGTFRQIENNLKKRQQAMTEAFKTTIEANASK
ncbi:MAG: tetratricopeptide repeat protein [Cyclobacteriaceae bacterium]|nr:tetratricopeptide repeat protein [Cyclobacteriaceae bacterium]